MSAPILCTLSVPWVCPAAFHSLPAHLIMSSSSLSGVALREGGDVRARLHFWPDICLGDQQRLPFLSFVTGISCVSVTSWSNLPIISYWLMSVFSMFTCSVLVLVQPSVYHWFAHYWVIAQWSQWVSDWLSVYVCPWLSVFALLYISLVPHNPWLVIPCVIHVCWCTCSSWSVCYLYTLV